MVATACTNARYAQAAVLAKRGPHVKQSSSQLGIILERTKLNVVLISYFVLYKCFAKIKFRYVMSI
jgi:hypothetical protein